MRDDELPLLRPHSLAGFDGLVQAISTRHGGLSSGPFASLNLGWTVGDEREHVEANYRRLAAALGVPREHLTTTWQVHGNIIVRASAADRGSMIAKADGIITDQPGLPLTQRYADCTPVLVYDPHRHAIGLAHAGWRGTVAGVTSALVQAMAQAFGSDPACLLAVVGPAIGPCCYEVGPEVTAAVQGALADSAGLLSWPGEPADGVSAPAGRPAEAPQAGRPHFDLWQANRRQLAQAGVQHIEVTGICTRCQRDAYFSHRGDNGRTGRFAAVMMLRS